MAGRAVLGYFVTFAITLAALVITRPLGVVRPSYELLTTNWAGQVTLAYVLLSIALSVVLYAVARDIDPLAYKIQSKGKPQ